MTEDQHKEHKEHEKGEEASDWVILIIEMKWNNGVCKTNFSQMAFHSKDNIPGAVRNIKCRYILENIDKLNNLLSENFTSIGVSEMIKQDIGNLDKYYWLLNNPNIEISPGIRLKGEFPHIINVFPLKFND